MAFLVPRTPLTPGGSAPHVNPAAKILSGADYLVCREAEDLIARATEHAAAIVTSAQAAYDEHCERGYRDGTERARLEQTEKMIDTVSRTVDYFSNVEADMVELVIGSVRKIVDGYSDREKVLIVVRNMLAVVRNQKQMTLRLHPRDVAVVQARVSELLAAYPGAGYLDIVADEGLAQGACILESGIGVVRTSLDDQLQALRGAFERVLGGRV